MNETLQSIRNRRSTRIFLLEQIKEEEIQAILEAGIYAPSAHNEQSWHFTVIQNKELLDRLNSGTKEICKNSEIEFVRKMGNNEKFNIFYNAPTVIIVSGEKKAMMPEVDCAAATENILIAAESLGVGTCWVGFIKFLFEGENKEVVKNELGIPEGYKPYYAVALGYKKFNNAKAPERRENTVNYIR